MSRNPRSRLKVGDCSPDWTVFREMLKYISADSTVGGRARALQLRGLQSVEHLLGNLKVLSAKLSRPPPCRLEASEAQASK